MMRSRAGLALALATFGVACSPAFDWRDVRPAGEGIGMLFPCRPERRERTVTIDAEALKMRMHSCKASGANFSLTIVDAGRPERVSPVLATLRAQSVANVAGSASASPFAVRGSTPNAETAMLAIEGRLPGGARVAERAGFFVRGQRLYQASVVSDAPESAAAREAIETFFGSIRLDP